MELSEIVGVGEATAKRLRAAGFTNVESIAVTPTKELMERAGYQQLAPAVRIVEAARQLLGSEFITAWEHWQLTKNRDLCTTGSKALDTLLGGGIETQAITELVGQYSAGKTQLCLELCVTSQLPSEEGGFGSPVLYFDTEGTFSSKRVHQIASHKGLNPEETLQNIILSRVYTSDHQMFLMDHAFTKCAEEKIRLVIVDSVISHFRGEFVGRERLAERQQKLNHYMHKLLRLAEIFNLAVVVTNQAQANPTATYGYNITDRPAGGHILAHACNTRVWLRRGKGGLKRVARIIDSPCLPQAECVFQVTEKGIEDAEE